MNETEKELILSDMGKQITELAIIVREMKTKLLKLNDLLVEIQNKITEETSLQWAYIHELDKKLDMFISKL